MKKIFKIMLLLLSISILGGCSKIKEIDISKYIEVSVDGYQGYGTINLSLNNEFFKDKDIFGEGLVDYSSLENYSVEVIANKSDMLNNEDVIELSLKYDEEIYKNDLKVKLVNDSKKEYTVSGLIKAFMTQKDISKENYEKLKEETYEKVKKYLDSTNKSNVTYGEIEFIDGFIKNPIKEVRESGFEVPTLVYLYKVNKTEEYTYTSPLNTVNYIFVSVNGITLDNEDNLSSYLVADIEGGLFSEDVKSYNIDSVPDIQSVKGDYLNTNEVLERLEM